MSRKANLSHLAPFLSTVRSLALFVWLCLSAGATAQQLPFVPPVYNHHTGSHRAGNQNWAVAQGYDGVIYIGNNNGLLRFDGTNRELHKLPNGLSVKSVFIDSVGRNERIYIGSFEEFGYFEADETQQLVYHSLIPSVKGYTFRNDEIWTIHKHEHTIFFQSFSSYFAYDPQRKTIRHEKPYPAPLYFFKAGNNLFAQFIHEDFYLFRNGTWERLLDRQQTGNDDIVGVLPFGSNLLLVSSQNGLFLFEPISRKIQPWKTQIDDELREGVANRAVCTKDTLVVIGTLNKGVFAVDKNGTKKWSLDRQNGLNNNTVLGLFNDRENNLWAALDNGVSQIRTNSVLSLFEPAENPPGMVEDMLIVGDKLYLATNQGVYTYDTKNRRSRRLPKLDMQAWFVRGFDTQIITGNNSGSAFIENDRAIPTPTDAGGTDIKQMRHNGQDILLESTYTYLSVYKKNADNRWTYANRIDGFYDLINSLETDHTGNLWAGHMYKGVYRIRLNSPPDGIDEKEYFSRLDPTDSTAADIRVMKLAGRVVLTDGKTFHTYDDITRRIIPYEQLNNDLYGFADARRIVPVNDSLFWLIRDNEYLLIARQKGTYLVREKIPFALLNHPPNTGRGNVYVSRQGVSYLSLNGGIARFIPENISRQQLDRLRLRAVTTYNRKKGKTQRLCSTPECQPTTIGYADNNVTFAFQYTDFSRKTFTLECLLEPYDSRPIKTGNDLKIDYTNLPAGEYTLKASVKNDLGDEMSTLSFAFRIDEPWYKTNRAIALYLLATLLGIYLSMRFFVKRTVRKKNEMFLRQEQKRLAQLEEQQRQITALRNERLEADLTHKGKELASATMNIINQKEFLNKLKTEIQTFLLSGKINKAEGHKLLAMIDESLSEEDEWAVFQENFDLIHENFFRKLQEQYPTLTPTDLKLCALLRLNYSSKEIAHLLNLTIRGTEAARYRLRKKLHLSEDVNLVSFMIDFR